MNGAEVKELLEKARQSAEAANVLWQNGFADFSASRSYYAMFYSIEALFLHQDRSFSSHKAVISAFGREFIKTGIFPATFHQYILEAFDLRNTGDYGSMYAIEEKKAQELIQNATAMIEAIEGHLFP